MDYRQGWEEGRLGRKVQQNIQSTQSRWLKLAVAVVVPGSGQIVDYV